MTLARLSLFGLLGLLAAPAAADTSADVKGDKAAMLEGEGAEAQADVPPPKQKLLLMRLKNTGAEDDEALAADVRDLNGVLAVRLSTDEKWTERFTLVPQAVLPDLIGEEATAAAIECERSACLQEVAAGAEVDWIIYGQIGAPNGGRSIEVRMFDAAKGRVVNKADAEGFSGIVLASAMPEVLEGIYPAEPEPELEEEDLFAATDKEAEQTYGPDILLNPWFITGLGIAAVGSAGFIAASAYALDAELKLANPRAQAHLKWVALKNGPIAIGIAAAALVVTAGGLGVAGVAALVE